MCTAEPNLPVRPAFPRSRSPVAGACRGRGPPGRRDDRSRSRRGRRGRGAGPGSCSPRRPPARGSRRSAPTTLATAWSRVRALPASVPSGRRGAVPSWTRPIPPTRPRLPRHGVGDEHHLVHRLAPEGDRERGRVHVDQVGDQRDRHPVVGEQRTDHPRGPVVESAHAVEAVGHQPGAGVDARGGLLDRRRSSGRGSRARPRSTSASIAATAPSGSGADRDQDDDVVEPVEPVPIGRDDQVGRMRAGPAAEERPLEVRARDGRTRPRTRRRARDPGQGLGVPVERRGDERGAPGRDPLGHEVRVEACPSPPPRPPRRRRRRCR